MAIATIFPECSTIYYEKQAETIMKFEEQVIQGLFGHEAAEDEDLKRLKEYYFKGDSYKQVRAERSVRILVGHKGIGKSALFQVAIAEDKDFNQLAVLVQPNDISKLGQAITDQKDFLDQ